MAKKARSEEQILRALHQAESGERVADICREHGVSEGCYFSSIFDGGAGPGSARQT